MSNAYTQNQSVNNGIFTLFTYGIIILVLIHISNGACGSELIEALCYKLEGCGFNSR
jgi:hypothetical protein